jgi:hypothetical protein
MQEPRPLPPSRLSPRQWSLFLPIDPTLDRFLPYLALSGLLHLTTVAESPVHRPIECPTKSSPCSWLHTAGHACGIALLHPVTPFQVSDLGPYGPLDSTQAPAGIIYAPLEPTCMFFRPTPVWTHTQVPSSFSYGRGIVAKKGLISIIFRRAAPAAFEKFDAPGCVDS